MAKKFNLADYVQPEAVSDSGTPEVTMLRFEVLRMNPRNFYEVEGVGDLVDSLKLNGLLDPIVVYKGSGILYTILSGHRRYRAISIIRGEKDYDRRFDQVPCIVRPAPTSTAMEDILLIQANSTGRIRTPADMAEEARRLTAALVTLKKQGVELPGRLRDAVADAMGVSSSKLGRIQAIENNLQVPGFKSAWKAGKLPEAAAYELAQLSPEHQYAALDLLIDEGVDYEKADIKAVQRIKRRVALGESPAQDLAAEAEKRKIYCPEGDYSPLFAALLREALPDYLQRQVRRCGTKAAGVQALHDFGFSRCSHYGGGVDYDSDPQAILIRSPVGRRIKWSDVWELLMLPGGDGEPAAAPDPMTAATVAVSSNRWRSCRDDPPEGWTLAIKFYPWDTGGHDFDLELVQYHDGKWYGVFEGSDDELAITMYDLWMPAAPPPAEAWE